MELMQPSQPGNAQPEARERTFSVARTIILAALGLILAICIAFALLTRDAMAHRPASTPASGQGVRGIAGRTIVDQSPWETIENLAPLATTAEENEIAREAQRLADHEVDQAFAAALREATLRAQDRVLSGEALRFSQRIDQLQEMVKQDQAIVQQLSDANGKQGSSDSGDDTGNSDLDIAKAQLGLDSDELTDAIQDLARATGDERPQIQSELSAHESAMKQYDGHTQTAQVATLAMNRYGTLAGRVGAWMRQRSRLELIERAREQAISDASAFAETHKKLEAEANRSRASIDVSRNAHMKVLKSESAERQLLSIYDDRIATEQRLATAYQRWADQLRLQHRTVLHLILNSLAWIVAILVCMVVADTIVRRLSTLPRLDRRQRQTLRAILEMAVQSAGALIILLIIFGIPHQTPTIVGLATAALTIALQDFVLAFFGWFVLMGKKGIRVGDIVEINGVGGEVTEIGLMSTTLLETGTLAEKGYATGRRITFLNSFAIRGQYFDFSTSGQWMLDQFEVTVPATDQMATVVDAILNAVEQVTGENARQAEVEWRRAAQGQSLQQLHPEGSVNVRPVGNDFGVEVRYVTRASERVDTRNRLYRRVVDLLHQPQAKA